MPEQIISSSGAQYGLIVTPDGRAMVDASGTSIYVGEVTPAAEVLIDNIIFKTIKIHMYQRACFETTPLEKLSKQYLPLSNSLRLDLLALSQLSGNPKPPDLQNYLDSKYGKDK